MSNKIIGTVKWFNESKGFGFIERQEGPDAFAHYSAIESAGSDTLQEGQKVLFSLKRGLRGFHAQNISAAK